MKKSATKTKNRNKTGGRLKLSDSIKKSKRSRDNEIDEGREEKNVGRYDEDSDNSNFSGRQRGKYSNGEFSGSLDGYSEHRLDEDSYDSGNKSRATNSSRRKTKKGSSPERKLRSKHTQACRYLRQAKFDKALQCFERILEVLIEKHGEQHHRVGAAMHNIGIVHLRAGDLSDALEALELAVAVRKAALGKLHSKVADSLVEMGIVYLSMKKYDNALDVLNEALDLREWEVSQSRDSKKQLLVAKILNNIGCVYYEYGDMRAARKTLNEALKIQEEILGAEQDPAAEPGLLGMASTMCNVGYVCLSRRKYDDAMVMFEEALAIQEEVLGGDNSLVLHTMDNLAFALIQDNNLDNAMKIYLEILDIQLEMVGQDALEIAETRKKITYTHLKQYQFDQALQQLNKILAVQNNFFDRRDKQIRDTKKLINGVNYHLLKFHNPKEFLIIGFSKQGLTNPFTGRTVDFSNYFGKVKEELDISSYKVEKPDNISKVSGHKITYA